MQYDIIYHHFPINSQFEDVGGWQPCSNVCEAAPVSLIFWAPNVTDLETHSKFPFNLASHCTYSNPATQVGTQNKDISAVSQTDVTRILLPSVRKDAKVHQGVNARSFK